ncbi:hypothetical protein ES707_01388 [subsurface metagenome]
MQEKNIATFPRPCFNRIPNFVGSWIASEKIKQIPEFNSSRCVFCAPDFVLKRIREIVLESNKILAVALPHMAEFLEISERRNINRATSIKGFKKYGVPLKTEVGLFVEGSVAVDKKGNRLGKGRGYGDKEWSYLLENNLFQGKVKVITLVHDEQIVEDFSNLMTETDKKVDYILTPTTIIKIKKE